MRCRCHASSFLYAEGKIQEAKSSGYIQDQSFVTTTAHGATILSPKKGKDLSAMLVNPTLIGLIVMSFAPESIKMIGNVPNNIT